MSYDDRRKVAIDMAAKAHGDQKYGDFPYLYHLIQVENVIIRFGLSIYTELRLAALLHDTIEDTHITSKIIEETEGLGREVANLVYLVTNELGGTRKERKAKTFAKTATNRSAILLKLADRIANVESCLEGNNNNLLKMYQKEHLQFQGILYIYGATGVLKEMQDYLNDLLEEKND